VLQIARYHQHRPWRHHFVPQFYQRAFALRTGKSWQAVVLDKTTGVSQRRNVRDSFKIRDWNTIENADGTKDFTVEELMARAIEDPTVPAMANLRAGRFPLIEQHRMQLAVFMSAQLTRGRFHRENLKQFIEETERLSMKVWAAHVDDARLREMTSSDPAEVRERLLHNERYFHVEPTNALLLQTTLSSVLEIAELLAKRTWTLVTFQLPCLLTAENPVVHINPSGDSMGYGVVTAERLYMPVSPTSGLLLSHPWTDWPEALLSGRVILRHE
jgi:hypothetical protein